MTDPLRTNYVSTGRLSKPLQTGLLLATGLAGYMSARCPIFNMGTIVGTDLAVYSLPLAGSTVLNMW